MKFKLDWFCTSNRCTDSEKRGETFYERWYVLIRWVSWYIGDGAVSLVTPVYRIIINFCVFFFHNRDEDEDIWRIIEWFRIRWNGFGPTPWLIKSSSSNDLSFSSMLRTSYNIRELSTKKMSSQVGKVVPNLWDSKINDACESYHRK